MESLTNEQVFDKVKENYEDVVILLDNGFEKAIRGFDTFTVGCGMGRMTVTPDKKWYHSMMGSRPTFNKQELLDKINKLEEEKNKYTAALSLF